VGGKGIRAGMVGNCTETLWGAGRYGGQRLKPKSEEQGNLIRKGESAKTEPGLGTWKAILAISAKNLEGNLGESGKGNLATHSKGSGEGNLDLEESREFSKDTGGENGPTCRKKEDDAGSNRGATRSKKGKEETPNTGEGRRRVHFKEGLLLGENSCRQKIPGEVWNCWGVRVSRADIKREGGLSRRQEKTYLPSGKRAAVGIWKAR